MATNDATYVTALTYLSSQYLHHAAQYLIFTRPVSGKSNELEIGATDGFDRMFRNNFAWDKVKNTIGEKLSNDVVVGRVRDAFQKSQVRLRDAGVKLQVLIGGDERCVFELYETPAPDVRLQSQRILFALAGRCMELRNELHVAKGGEGVGTSAEEEAHVEPKSSRRQKVDFSKTSIINPGTKRKRAATGLKYD